MAFQLSVDTAASRETRYQQVIPQIKSLVQGEPNLVANLANISAVLKTTFDFFWIGFYMVENDELVLGPFQGPLACTRISKGKGVSGAVWESQNSIVVPNVNEFPGHIACSANSLSEIVVPIVKEGNVIGVIDVDSDREADFDETDRIYLEEISSIISAIA